MIEIEDDRKQGGDSERLREDHRRRQLNWVGHPGRFPFRPNGCDQAPVSRGVTKNNAAPPEWAPSTAGGTLGGSHR